jgi:hypothetical protein
MGYYIEKRGTYYLLKKGDKIVIKGSDFRQIKRLMENLNKKIVKGNLKK